MWIRTKERKYDRDKWKRERAHTQNVVQTMPSVKLVASMIQKDQDIAWIFVQTKIIMLANYFISHNLSNVIFACTYFHFTCWFDHKMRRFEHRLYWLLYLISWFNFDSKRLRVCFASMKIEKGLLFSSSRG